MESTFPLPVEEFIIECVLPPSRYNLSSHTCIRFRSCTSTQCRIVLSPLPRLIIIIRIHTLIHRFTYI